MKLYKKYRVVYNEKKEILLCGEFSLSCVTYIGVGNYGKDFETKQDMDYFIEENGLFEKEYLANNGKQ